MSRKPARSDKRSASQGLPPAHRRYNLRRDLISGKDFPDIDFLASTPGCWGYGAEGVGRGAWNTSSANEEENRAIRTYLSWAPHCALYNHPTPRHLLAIDRCVRRGHVHGDGFDLVRKPQWQIEGSAFEIHGALIESMGTATDPSVKSRSSPERARVRRDVKQSATKVPAISGGSR